MKPVLVAGIGNIFHGDDGFGVEVAQRLARLPQPTGVEVVDFGIRGLDLAYALSGGCRYAVLVDTVQRGEAPGTLYVIEPEVADAGSGDTVAAISPHQIDPASVLRFARLLGGSGEACAKVLLVGCEPATFGDAQEGRIGLSAEVAAAVAPAVETVGALVAAWLAEAAGEPVHSNCKEWVR